jgi:hypothetical protein
MGLFDFLFGGSVEQQIQKHAKRIKSKDTPIEDRQASAHWLAENGTPAAIRGLIGRFEMDYEHGMKDTSEKEEVSQLLIGLGQVAVEPLRVCLLKTEKFARPLALYAQLTSQDEAMRLTVEMIEAEATRAELHPDKRRNLLVKLADFKDPSLVAVARSALPDYDEGCRYAAVEVLAAQDETAEVREALIGALVNPKEESTRLRARVANIASTRRWTLDAESAAALEAHAVRGYVVRDGALVATA